MSASYVLAITSVGGGAGRTTVSRGLAVSLARVGHRVAWVGADLAEGPLRDGVDRGLRASFEAVSAASVGPLQRVGSLDEEDSAYATATGAPLWAGIFRKLSERAEVVVVDAPRGALAEPVLIASSHVLVLVPLDRPAPPLEPLVTIVKRARAQTGTVLAGLVVTRFDALRRGAPRALEEALSIAPAHAWLRPLVPDGSGAARDGAIDELARRFCDLVGLRDPKPRSISQVPGAYGSLHAEAS